MTTVHPTTHFRPLRSAQAMLAQRSNLDRGSIAAALQKDISKAPAAPDRTERNSIYPSGRRTWMAAMLGILLLVHAGCKSTPVYPDPQPGESQIVVRLQAIPKVGVRGPKVKRDGYTFTSAEKGRRYTRVEYGNLPDIAVMLTGSNLPKMGPAIRSTQLVIDKNGFDRGQVLLGPDGTTHLVLHNRRPEAISVFCVGVGTDGFDVDIDPGQSARVTLRNPGTYEIVCDGVGTWTATAIVAETGFAQMGISDDEVFFDHLSPGTYGVKVIAPRLPVWTGTVRVEAGKRVVVDTAVTVNTLPKAR